MYLISELATRTELSIDAINYYIRIGLIKEKARLPDTNYRLFDDSTVAVLRTIYKLRREKHSLKKIRQILEGGNHK